MSPTTRGCLCNRVGCPTSNRPAHRRRRCCRRRYRLTSGGSGPGWRRHGLGFRAEPGRTHSPASGSSRRTRAASRAARSRSFSHRGKTAYSTPPTANAARTPGALPPPLLPAAPPSTARTASRLTGCPAAAGPSCAGPARGTPPKPPSASSGGRGRRGHEGGYSLFMYP